MTDRASRSRAVLRALEEVRFGAERILNLRVTLPTPENASMRADQWLRGQQAQQGGEVLIITGRGNQSIGGISPVREAVRKLLRRLKRLGVVSSAAENTPGSFIVTLAPMRALLEASPRHKGREDERPSGGALPGLDPASHGLLRQLATHALIRLGVRDTESFVNDEMRRQFSLIVGQLPEGLRRDEHLRAALERAIHEYDDEA